MGGETEKDVSGWTVDTLKRHFDDRITELVRTTQQRQEELKQHGDEAVVALREHALSLIATAERGAQQSVESLRAVMHGHNMMDEQRFAAQEKAIINALNSAEKAVNAALIAAKEAVQKAEFANEKRFESVNAFRAQLADQASQLMSRAEAEARINSLVEKVAELQQRADRTQGRSGGLNQGWVYLVSAIGAVLVLGQLAGLLVNLFTRIHP